MSPRPCPRCQEPLNAPGQPCPRCGAIEGGTANLPLAGTPIEHGVAEILAGDVLGEGYEVVRKLGEGGMATVFLARDRQLARDVAVKVLAAHLCRDPQAVQRFEREARATAHFDHPNIIPIYAVGRFRERPFMVMKLLDGVSLAELVAKKKSPWVWSEVRPIFTQLCAGLGALHAKGLVHRDVKPSNIFVSPSGHVTLLDFGIIKEVSKDHTGSGLLLGTVRYMAPEQLVEANLVDERADVYAVGVVLYRLLTGHVPFEGDDFKVAQAKLSEDPPSADELNPNLSRAVAEALSRAVNRDRTSRFQSVRELLAALDHSSLEKVKRRRRWRPVIVAALTVALLGALTALGWVIVRPSDRPVAASPPAPPPVEPIEPPAPLASLEHEATASKATTAPLATEPKPPVRKPLASPPRPPNRPPPVESASSRTKLSVQATVGGQPTVAELSIDGVAQGEAPLQLELSAGPHRVRVAKDGYRPYEKTLTLGSKPERLVVELQR